MGAGASRVRGHFLAVSAIALIASTKPPPSLKLGRVSLRESDTMKTMIAEWRCTVRFQTRERPAKTIRLIQSPANEIKTLAPGYVQDVTNPTPPQFDAWKGDNKSAKLFHSASHPTNDTEVLSFQ
jgi:endonuclease YncB( thermonuclease family)